MSTITWEKIEVEAEHNEECAIINGVGMSIFSDKDGRLWGVKDNDTDEIINIDLSSKELAKVYAKRYAEES